ncbi:MAG: Gfo/Idh/MocA family oxidoreductase [Candidatus Omnitrophica bacterium]|nr:Gfo/Idh/MocA family oxidoreductase [Candidatus Omnitrophota bacterium]
MKKQLRAAVIGCGRIASLFAADKKRRYVATHAQGYLRNPDTRLVAACDIDAERLAAFGKQWKINRLYTDAKALFAKERPDLVSICTPPASHGGLVQLAARMGVRGIICEKPLSVSLPEARRIVGCVRQKGVHCAVNYTRRYLELFCKVQAMIRRGDLGRIQGVSCYYSAGVFNTGTHLFDYLRMFFGEVDWVWADPNAAGTKADPEISGYLHFKQGFGCTLQSLEVKPYLLFEADIFGTQKRLRMVASSTAAEIWETRDHPMFSGYRELLFKKRLEGSLAEGIPSLIRDMVRSLRRGQAPACSAEDGYRSLEIASALCRSLRTRKRVSLPLSGRRLDV